MEAKTYPPKFAWQSHILRPTPFLLVGRNALWRRHGGDKGDEDDKYDGKKKATIDSKG